MLTLPAAGLPGARPCDEGEPTRGNTERYAIADLLGQGGMAEVFRAWDRERSIWCAVKVLLDRYAQKPSARRRFVEEGRTIMALRHRNLIEAYDLDEHAPRPFLVMELAEGGSMMDWVNRHGQMPPRLAVDAALQVSKGLGAAHAAGVVHRDVKPHNILLSRRGLCKVTDFGIARIMMDGHEDVPSANTLPSQGVMGTLGYMAPEQRTDPRSADVRTDIYGIGATLYTLLTGTVETNLFVAERDPQKLAGVPECLVPVLMRATAYRVEQRYATVEDLRIALFEASKALPPDPPDAPASLAQALPDLPDPAPPAPVVASNSPRPSASAVRPARRDTRRQRTPDNEARTRPIVVIAALAGIAVGLVVLDLLHVRLHEGAALRAAHTLSKKASLEISLCDTMGRYGAPVAALEAAFEEVHRSRGRPVVAAASGRALIDELNSHKSQVPTQRYDVVVSIEKLAKAQDSLAQEVEDWESVADFPCLAHCIGLTQGPY